MDFRKILLNLKVIQEVSNIERRKKGLQRLGKGYEEAYRFNPYNPLSYISLIIIYIISFFLHGIIGIIEEKDAPLNPFKWY